MVYKVLEAAADEVLLYMRANKLAANPEIFFYDDWDKKRHRRSE
jgi:tRNA G46 methylase TrmB